MPADPLEPIRQKFRVRCGQDLKVLRETRADPAQTFGEDCKLVIHRLSGMAGSLGYGELSRLARTIDDAFARDQTPLPEDLDRLAKELSAIAIVAGV